MNMNDKQVELMAGNPGYVHEDLRCVSCLACWFCNCCLGCGAFIYSRQANAAAKNGEYARAHLAKKTAKKLIWASVILGIIMITISLIISLTLKLKPYGDVKQKAVVQEN
mmetsp:Transcript_52573/g.64401  ORF Transcript_52573/g.64401 Transcript_52573/m.64401 type:complete len:110 (-) Transcript_52573:76-405(-)